MTTPTLKPALSLVRDLLRVYDHRFLQMEPTVRRQMVSAAKGALDGLLTPEARRALPEHGRMRVFCIENELFDELERLISDEAAGHREGAVVVGGRVYAVYPYLRGVPRQDADITAEVGVEHCLEALSWSKGILRAEGWARIARVQAKDPVVRLVLNDGRDELEVEAEPLGDGSGGFSALLDVPQKGSWTARVEVETLGLRRSAPFGTRRPEGFKPPKEREGAVVDLTEGLRITWVHREEEPPRRRSWRFWRGRQA